MRRVHEGLQCRNTGELEGAKQTQIENPVRFVQDQIFSPEPSLQPPITSSFTDNLARYILQLVNKESHNIRSLKFSVLNAVLMFLFAG